MQRSVERCFGNSSPASPAKWLTDNGLAYLAHEARTFVREIGWSPEWVGETRQSEALRVGSLAIELEHYNEHQDRSPRKVL